ncbi:hypothetical protein PO883_02285 [Massilia sp. DJPM01]|uniref:hypothetical protein n=1 Tax=Massilia sp. DJPM01 TaxID=3024404 RepID=UPI00259E7D02|nr:hypothetical protein [Massilia sp. DJPM01]MDM5176028.1 hypothetical protein [Massilia sp. DJPM01]
MTFSTVFFCLLAARVVSDMLSLFSEHPIFDIISGIIVLPGAATLLVADAGDAFGYVALVMAMYYLAVGAMALSRRKRPDARPASARMSALTRPPPPI